MVGSLKWGDDKLAQRAVLILPVSARDFTLTSLSARSRPGDGLYRPSDRA